MSSTLLDFSVKTRGKENLNGKTENNIQQVYLDVYQ